MSINNITGTQVGPLVVNAAGNTYNIKQGATLVYGGSGGGGISAAIVENLDNPAVNHDNIYSIDGRAIGSQVGVYTVGNRDQINIGSTGEVIGSYGVVFEGKNVGLTNNGEIVARSTFGVEGNYGIYSHDTSSAEIRNNGTVSGAAGIFHDGGNLQIVNGSDGFITGTQAGIAAVFGISSGSAAAASGESPSERASADFPSVEITNHGTVAVNAAGSAAFLAVDFNVTLINDGLLKGGVELGDGNSLFDNRGGRVTGVIDGGDGNDVLIVDSASCKLAEEQNDGNDTVKSTVTYTIGANVENLALLGNADSDATGNSGDNTIRGNAGDNVLKGLSAADHLFGGKGSDRLWGGADGDTFHFSSGDAHDRIMDLVQGTDKIDLGGWDAIDTFAHLKSHAQDQGGDVLITAGGDSLLIVGLHKADLNAASFDFAA